MPCSEITIGFGTVNDLQSHCSPFVPVVLRPSHDKQLRQKMDEHLLHPRRHDVCLRRSEVNVEHDHCDTYAAK